MCWMRPVCRWWVHLWPVVSQYVALHHREGLCALPLSLFRIGLCNCRNLLSKVWGVITPGVLFWVICQCSLSVMFNMHLGVGLHDFMMGLALISCGIVMMGVASITLCYASHTSHCLASSTLCSSGIGGGVSRSLIQVPRRLSKRLPLGVVFPSAVYLVNSPVRARRWTQVIDNVAEIIPLILKCGKLLYLGCNNGHISNDLLKN